MGSKVGMFVFLSRKTGGVPLNIFLIQLFMMNGVLEWVGEMTTHGERSGVKVERGEGVGLYI